MERLDATLLELGRMDALAAGDSPLHRLDPRVKVVVTFLYLATVASLGPHEVSWLLPLALYPALLIAWGGLPLGFFARRLLAASPFVLFVAIFSAWIDRRVLFEVGGWHITGGWMACLSITVRFVMTVTAALVLLASTGLYPVGLALQRLRVPRVFVVQMLFVHRYLFVLGSEAARVVRAHALRAFSRRAMSPRVFASVLGQMLLRTMDRAERVHLAMLSRGFDGEIRMQRRLRMGAGDWAFLALWAAYFVAARRWNLAQALGRWTTGG